MGEPDRVFYDGGCGLCHRAVRFALDRDLDGSRFRFAPLNGKAYTRRIPEARREVLPDSLVVLDPQGGIHTRAAGVIRILRRIEGGWGLLGGVLDALPAGLAEFGYVTVARVRRRLFAPPENACPVVPPGQCARFEE